MKIFNRLLQRADFDGLHEPRLLNEFFGKGSFTFVDVGANYPETSLSTPLEMAGWSGVVIEPQPSCINMLRKYRKCKIVQCACSSYDNQNKKMKLWVAGPLSSLNLEFISPKNRPKKFIYVDIKTLDQILVENHIQSIDLLAIDAEGAEIDVLNGLDFKKFPPKLILIEDHARDFVKHHFLKKKGYKLFKRTGYNAWYAKEKHVLPLGFVGMMQLWIKYYVGGPLRNFRRWRHQHSL